MPLPRLTLVVGGACSGKSAFAEALVVAEAPRPTYIATAQAFDDEMRAKIADHQAARGPGWHTIEAPLDLAAALASADPTAPILIDCATLWLSNLLLAEADMTAAEDALFAALPGLSAPLVVVSNEVGQGVVPESKLGRQFRTVQGRFNQRLAAQADLVVTVIAGLPLTLKGTLP